jgi:hypothetical protein
MSTLTHPQTCHCSLHAQIQINRHACYRQLAQAILGPAAPLEDLPLARALAVHARLLEPAEITPIRRTLVA